MGKRSGMTKSGRVMNPADRERKLQRAKELKRNKKERVKIRETIVKGRDAQELIERLERLDDQEFSLSNELAQNVMAEKRGKYTRAFRQQLGLYRRENDETHVKELEQMWNEYEVGKKRKGQHYQALLFEQSGDTEEIPLPDGSMAEGAALTPFMPPPLPPQFNSTVKAGILKKSVHPPAKGRKYPPGPPRGLPPDISDTEPSAGKARGEDDGRRVRFSSPDREPSGRGARFAESKSMIGGDDEDYDAVEIPESMLVAHPPAEQPVYSRHGAPNVAIGRASAPVGPYPPGFSIPANVPPEIHAQLMRQGRGMDAPTQLPPPSKPPSATATTSASNVGPQVFPPSEDVPKLGPVISAAPQIRNLVGESTRFVPTALRVPKSQTVTKPAGKRPNVKRTTMAASNKQMGAATASVDEACDQFLKEIQDLL